MKKWMTENKTLIVLVLMLVVAVALAGGIYLAAQPDTMEGSKQITVAVVDAQQEITQFEFATDAQTLRGALEQQNLVAGEDTGSGLFVKTVNGIAADESQQQWWCFTKNGETLMTGVDTTPIADGDVFQITLTTGW